MGDAWMMADGTGPKRALSDFDNLAAAPTFDSPFI
jgi:hypothetical protein